MLGRLHHVVLDCPNPVSMAAFYSLRSPQQIHVDITVEDVAAAEPRLSGLGATKLDGEHVYADPAGHPLCLISRPGWAPPVSS